MKNFVELYGPIILRLPTYGQETGLCLPERRLLALYHSEAGGY